MHFKDVRIRDRIEDISSRYYGQGHYKYGPLLARPDKYPLLAARCVYESFRSRKYPCEVSQSFSAKRIASGREGFGLG